MRIVCISDTHGLHSLMANPLPMGDVLIHAGDCTNRGMKSEVEEFVQWMMDLKGFEHKIFIAGNHDFAFEIVNQPHHKGDFDWFHHLMNEENLSQSDVTYLEDSFVLIQPARFSRPLKIYGSPWQPEFYNWAFNLPRNGSELEEKWGKIPDDTDILITHGPPFGLRDYVPRNYSYDNVGCEILRNRIEKLNLIAHIFGHIHNAYGSSRMSESHYINASICNQHYVPINKSIVLDVQEKDGKIFVNDITYE